MRIRSCLLALILASGVAEAATLELISGTGVASDFYGHSSQPALSADGRYVAFLSDAPNLVPGQQDDNHTADVFLHDSVTGATTLVSHVAGSPTRTAGPPAPGSASGYGALGLSADGRYLVFLGWSKDLVPGAADGNGLPDVFLWDRVTGTTTLVSHAAGSPGTAADSSSYDARISADGSVVAILSNAGNLVAGQTNPPGSPGGLNVFLWNRAADTFTLVSRGSTTLATGGNASSYDMGISADGSVVAFLSEATNLLPGIVDTNTAPEVYAWQRSTDTLSLVSRTAGAPQQAAGATGTFVSLSADGRYLAFASAATDLVPGQRDITPFTADAFLYDRTTGEMRLASHTSASPLVAGGIIYSSQSFTLSADGRYLAFSSDATNLVPGQVDTNDRWDLFVYDRVTGSIALASHSHGSATTAGARGDSSLTGGRPFSTDGRFLAFYSTSLDLVAGQTDAPFTEDVFLYDQASGSVTLVSRTPASASTVGNRVSFSPTLNADGSVVVFVSQATDLISGQTADQTDPYRFSDLFLYRRSTGEITSLSHRDPGEPPALTHPNPSGLGSLPADGRSVLFQRSPFDSANLFLRDTVADTTSSILLSLSPDYVLGEISVPVLSADGRFAAFISRVFDFFGFPPYRNAEALYLHDRAAGTFTLVNHPPGSTAPGEPDGSPATFALSADGRYVAYQCASCGLVPGHGGPSPASPGGRFHEIFVYDRLTGENTLISHALSSPVARADGPSYSPSISADGRFVVFWSSATTLVRGQTDVPGTHDLFAFDFATGEIELVTHVPGAPATAAGLLSASTSLVPADLSADGRFIAFQSALPNLVPGQVDANEGRDVFLRDQLAHATILVSHAAASQVTAGNGPSSANEIGDKVSMSADGRFIAYESLATDLVAGLPADTDANGAKDVFLYDRLTGASSLVSHAAGAPLTAGSGGSEIPRVSADGSHVAFLSTAMDLVPGPTPVPTGSSRNLYVRDRSAGTTIFIAGGVTSTLPFFPFPTDAGYQPLPHAPQLSADGRRIAFISEAPLVPGDYNGTTDVYLWDQDGVEEPEGPTPVAPCRLLDTRRRAERPILTSNVPRTVAAQGRCGMPATAKQVVVNVTVFNPSGKGNLRFYSGAATGAPSALLRFERGTSRTETFTLPLGPNGALTLLPFVAGWGTVHGAVEVTAYED